MALTDQLVAYWKTDESSGDAADSSGNSRTLTNNGTATYVSGKINNGVHLVSGSSQYLRRTDISGTTAGGSITIAAWVKINSAPGSGVAYSIADVASSHTSNFVSYIVDYFNNAGTQQLRFNRQRQGVSNNTITFNTDLGTGTYFYIVATYDGVNTTLYKNATSVAGPTAESGDGTGPNDTVDETVIGALHSAQANYATADIDEIGIWSRALSGTEITTLYNGGAGLSYPFAAASTSLPYRALLGVGI